MANGIIHTGQMHLAQRAEEFTHAVRLSDLRRVIQRRVFDFIEDAEVSEVNRMSTDETALMYLNVIRFEDGEDPYTIELVLEAGIESQTAEFHIMPPNSENPSLEFYNEADLENSITTIAFDGSGEDGVLIRFYFLDGEWVHIPISRIL